MVSPAKNPRFQPSAAGRSAGACPADGGDGAVTSDERRQKRDRRDPSRTDAYPGDDRRQGPRRAGDLPRPVWHHPLALITAIALGIAAGLWLGALGRGAPAAAAPVAVEPGRLDPELLAAIEGIRDEAEALTPAAVALDEHSHERWLPRVEGIELALADPATPASIRAELDATLRALERVGVIGR
jgi:hypothetical protein